MGIVNPIEVNPDVVAMRFFQSPQRIAPQPAQAQWRALLLLRNGMIVDAAGETLGSLPQQRVAQFQASLAHCASHLLVDQNAGAAFQQQSSFTSYWFRPVDGNPFEVARTAHGHHYRLEQCPDVSRSVISALDGLSVLLRF